MKIKPRNGHLLVEEFKQNKEEKSQHGIILAGAAIEDDQVSIGTVVRSGSKDYAEGSKVLFHKIVPQEVHLDLGDGAKLYFVISERDVLFTAE